MSPTGTIMPNWKILITDGLDESGLAVLRPVAQVDEHKGIDAQELLSRIPGYDALIVRSRTKVTPQVFESASNLKVIGRAGVGVDNIDLQAARAHGVVVVNTPQATSLAVAELTLALILSLARSIPRADHTMKAGLWIKKELLGVEINAKTLGIIGMGHIGAAVAQQAGALGMNVLGYDPLLPDDVIVARDAQPVPLAELYARSDFISLHVPLTDQTKDLIDAQALEQMHTGVYLLCTARGGIVDEEALAQALESGKVAGAALDVFAQEPPGVSLLINHPAVIATPHIGAQTVEAQERAARDIASEVLAALKSQPLRWKV
jgi:D-3-phosphoglycerate dehydrogenase